MLSKVILKHLEVSQETTKAELRLIFFHIYHFCTLLRDIHKAKIRFFSWLWRYQRAEREEKQPWILVSPRNSHFLFKYVSGSFNLSLFLRHKLLSISNIYPGIPFWCLAQCTALGRWEGLRWALSQECSLERVADSSISEQNILNQCLEWRSDTKRSSINHTRERE